MGWMIRESGFNSLQGQGIFSFSQHPDGLWGPSNLLFIVMNHLCKFTILCYVYICWQDWTKFISCIESWSVLSIHVNEELTFNLCMKLKFLSSLYLKPNYCNYCYIYKQFKTLSLLLFMYQIVGEFAFVILWRGRKRMQTGCSCHLVVRVFIIDFNYTRGGGGADTSLTL